MSSCFACRQKKKSPSPSPPKKTNKRAENVLHVLRGHMMASPGMYSGKHLARMRTVSRENRAVVNRAVERLRPPILRKIGNRKYANMYTFNRNLTFNNRSNLVNAALKLDKVRFTSAQIRYLRVFLDNLVYYSEKTNKNVRNGRLYNDANGNRVVANNVRNSGRLVRQNLPNIRRAQKKVRGWA